MRLSGKTIGLAAFSAAGILVARLLRLRRRENKSAVAEPEEPDTLLGTPPTGQQSERGKSIGRRPTR